jgi:hypothetical protein
VRRTKSKEQIIRVLVDKSNINLFSIIFLLSSF